MTAMPYRNYFDVAMTAMAGYMVAINIPFVSFLGIISGTLSVLYWMGRIKMYIDKHHEGSIWKWIKHFINK